MSESKAFPSTAVFSTVHDFIWPSSSATQIFMLSKFECSLSEKTNRISGGKDKAEKDFNFALFHKFLDIYLNIYIMQIFSYVVNINILSSGNK